VQRWWGDVVRLCTRSRTEKRVVRFKWVGFRRSLEFRIWGDVAQLCRRPAKEKKVVRFKGRGQ